MASATGRTNWFAIGISAAVVVVLVALAGFVVFLNGQAGAPGAAPQASGINAETGAITFGEGETEVATYVDFMCPVCGDFEAAYGKDLREAAEDDRITLSVHPIAILDAASRGTDYSSRAASALYCVAEQAPESALDFMTALFDNQPAEGSAGLTDEQMVAFADQTGGGAAAECITSGSYKKFVGDRTPETPANANGQIGTPTVAIDGERIENSEIATTFASILN